MAITHEGWVTALEPGDPDDGDQGRANRGLAIAALAPIEKKRLGYRVPSQTGNHAYIVNVDQPDEPVCTCPDFEARDAPCKHIWGVRYYLAAQQNGMVISPPEQRAARMTYPQDWPHYNLAQDHEMEHFWDLLEGLCDTIPARPPKDPSGRGAPPIHIADKTFVAALYVYSGMSVRRFGTLKRIAHYLGYMDRSPAAASVWRYMEDPENTPLLERLIQMSATPLRAVETAFSIDGTGFGTSVYDHYFEDRHGEPRYPGKKRARYIQAIAVCGNHTNVITSVAVTEQDASEAPYLKALLARTTENFNVREFSADKLYLGVENLWAIHEAGAHPYIPFKVNNRLHRLKNEKDALWNHLFHEYHLNRAKFLPHYHQRSNVESTFGAVKAKFGRSVSSKLPVAQVNEVLLKVLCYNLVVVVHSIYELGIDPVFAQINRYPTAQERRQGAVTNMEWYEALTPKTNPFNMN